MVGFPGLSIPDFDVDAVLLRVGGFPLRWYGLIIALGFALALLYAYRRSKDFGFKADQTALKLCADAFGRMLA